MDLAALTLAPARARPTRATAAPRHAFFHCCHTPGDGDLGHDATGKRELARRLASLLGYAFETMPRPADGPVYAVPSDTLTTAQALRLGVRGPDDVFGGVVPHAFVATKAITHPLVTPRAVAPLGWSAAFAREVSKVVLPGFTAFTATDAMEAGERLLRQHGCVRLKETTGVGGMGQCVVRDGAELARRIDALDPQALATQGLVLEHNLADLTTYSVGQVRVSGHLVSYHGTQHLTRNMHGHEVYGGSSLVVVRGGFDELLAMTTHEPVRQAVRRAMAYHRAARRCFRGFFASRANYDVVAGTDAAGRPQAGVLEQSWRIGGASGAEIAALEAFQADSRLKAVRASTHEVHADAAVTPADARVYFDGVDERIGRLCKYAVVQPHDVNA